jgi:hypothetical protein
LHERFGSWLDRGVPRCGERFARTLGEPAAPAVDFTGREAGAIERDLGRECRKRRACAGKDADNDQYGSSTKRPG